MNIIEETVGTYRVEITGMTIRQIKDVFEDKWGAMVWSGGAAYPSGDIKIQFKKALAALDAAQPVQVNAMLMEALERMVESVTGVDQVSAVDEARAALTAAQQAQPKKPLKIEFTKEWCEAAAKLEEASDCDFTVGHAQQAQPEPSEMTEEREAYIAGLESRTHEMRKKIEQLDYELRVARSSQEKATYTPPKIIDPDAPHPCFN